MILTTEIYVEGQQKNNTTNSLQQLSTLVCLYEQDIPIQYL